MDSSDGAKKYPITLYAEGKSPLQNKSMNHNCQLGNFSRVKEAIGNDAWDAIKESAVGLIPKLVDFDYVWSAKTVHFLLTRQLAIENAYEIWVVVGGQPIRFSLYEFAEITGLNTDVLPKESCEADYSSFWAELGVPYGVGPKYDELAKAFGRCRAWDLPKRKMLGLLCILHMGIYGIHHNSRMPLETAKRVFKDEEFAGYPWGRVAFKSLINGLKMVQFERKSYTVNGCVHALLFWAYESITVFGERFGRRNQSTLIPFLRWGGNRTRTDLEKVISNEIEQRGEVRVKRMVIKPIDEIYPTWDDDKLSLEVHNLIVDILEDKFVKGYWHAKQVQTCRPKVVKSEHRKEKRKIIDEGDVAEEGKVKKRKGGETMQVQDYHPEVSGNGGLLKLMEQMMLRFDKRFDGVDEKMNSIVAVVEEKLEVKFEEKYGHRITRVEDQVGDLGNQVGDLGNQVGDLGNEIKRLKDLIEAREIANSNKNDDMSKVFEGQEVNSPVIF